MKNSNLDIKQITTHVRGLLRRLQGYAAFLFIIGVLLIYSFLVLRISQLSQAEPDAAAIAEQQTIKRLKIDQGSISKIEELEDQNIGVQSLFESARDNPFED
jgi:hypothetical protein